MLTIETEDTYRAILNSAPDAMVLINESGIIQLINTQTEKLFGYSREELLGKEIEILIPARYRAGHKEKKLSFIKSPEVREMGSGLELYALHKNGTEFLVEIALSYVEANGKTSACAAIRDISEKKAAENKFKALLESAPDAMVIADSEGRIELVNAQTEKMFGYSRAELIGTEVEKLIPQRFTNRHRKAKMAFIEAPDVREMGTGIELFALRKDGTEFMVEVALSYIKNGDKTSACAAIRDIGDRKRLEKQNAQLASIVESSNDAIISKNIDRAIVSWNKGAELIFGYTAREILGEHINVLTPKDRRIEAELLIEQVLRGEVTRHKETKMLRKNGEEFHVSITCSPIRDADGNIVGVSQIVRDINQQKADGDKIKSLNIEMRELHEKLKYHKQLEDFAYITSHNLRSPVGNLASLFFMYDQQVGIENKDAIVEKLRTVTLHLTNTLNELSKALSIKTDTTIEKSSLSFADFFNAILVVCETEIEKSNAIVQSNFTACPAIHYPAIYLESILLNLLTNAIKYRHPNRQPVITFETYENRQHGKVLKVTDNGLGIDMERHGKKIFGLHKTFHRNADARGVGLFITKAQIEAMGGSITVSSVLGEGTVFTIYFERENQP